MLIKRPLIKAALILQIILPYFGAFAQQVVVEKTKTRKTVLHPRLTSPGTEVTIDLQMNTFSTNLPFDVDFNIKLVVGAGAPMNVEQIKEITCYYRKLDPKEDFEIEDWIADGKKKPHFGNWTIRTGMAADASTYKFGIKPLDPNRDFVFVFDFKRTLSESERKKLVEIAGKELRPKIEEKAKNKAAFEFTTGELNVLTENIRSKLQEYLQGLKLRVTFEDDNKENKLLRDGLITLSSQYEAQKGETRNLQVAVSQFDKNATLLSKYATSYASQGIPADKAENISKLSFLEKSKADILKFPDAEQIQIEAKADTYKSSLNLYQNKLAEIKIDDEAFRALQAEISGDIQLISIRQQEFSKSIASAKSITADKAEELIERYARALSSHIVVAGSTFNPDFKTRANNHVSADLGLAVLPSIGKMTPYLGTNIYFRPVNRDVPLKLNSNILTRLSLLVGLSTSSLEKANYRKDLLASNFNLITGAGLRIASFIRVNGGYIWYTALDPNPLNSNNSISGKPFVSISFDMDVKTVFHHLFPTTQTTP